MAAFFPLSNRKAVHRRLRPMQLRTAAGVVELKVVYGQDPSDEHWGCPTRESWGLTCHQQLSLGLEEQLAFTLTATNSYAEAAAVAAKWGAPISSAAMHALAQRLGCRAEAQAQKQLATVPPEREPNRAAAALAVLMIDGWLVRQRGPGWGKRKTPQPRVEWHEWKTGVYYRHDHAGKTAGGRGLISEKVVIGWQGDGLEFGRRLHWQGLREGLGRAQAKLIVADGAAWIWKLVQDRWAGSTEVLDFYHASQHLWELGRALHGQNETAAARWVEPRLHRLRHGQQEKVLREIRRLKPPSGEAGKIVVREQGYFLSHAHRLGYQAIHRRGWPIGSGAVESACRQRQCRFKRPGQFWTFHGMRNLGALTEARHNHSWDQLWLPQ